MSSLTQIPQRIKVVSAIVPTAGGTGSQTAVEVNGTGYNRCLWLVYTGAAATGATLAVKVQSATATSGSFSDVTNAASAGLTAAANANKVHGIDMPVSGTKPFMKLVATVAVDTFANAAVAVLYNGHNLPVATTYLTELVQI